MSRYLWPGDEAWVADPAGHPLARVFDNTDGSLHAWTKWLNFKDRVLVISVLQADHSRWLAWVMARDGKAGWVPQSQLRRVVT